MKRSTTAAVAAAVVLLALTGCGAGAPSTQLTESFTPTPTPAETPSNGQACLYLEDNALPDITEMFEAYMVARDTVTPAQVDAIANRFTVAKPTTSGALAAHIDNLLIELNGIQERFSTGDPLEPDVDYQLLGDSIVGVLDECIAALESE